MTLLSLPQPDGTVSRFSLSPQQLERLRSFVVYELDIGVLDDAPDMAREERAAQRAEVLSQLIIARLVDDGLLAAIPQRPVELRSRIFALGGCPLYWTRKMETTFIKHASRTRVNRLALAGSDAARRVAEIESWFDRQATKAGPGPRLADIKAEISAAMPSLPTVHNVEDGPVLSSWLENHGSLLTTNGQHELIRAMRCLRANREVYDVVLDVLLQSDPRELVSALFSGGRLGAREQVDVPAVLRPIVDFRTTVDGRGEAVIPLLFEGCSWNSGTDKHDIIAPDGPWHVKDMGNKAKVRLGCSGYVGSDIANVLVDLSRLPAWEDEGKAKVAKDLTRAVVRSNVLLLEAHWGGITEFQRQLDDCMRTSEADVRGIAFLRGDHFEVRTMDRVVCAGATAGDFQVSPFANQGFDVMSTVP